MFTTARPARAVVARPASRVAARPVAARSVEVKAPANALDYEELTEVLRAINESDVVEFELRSKRFSLAVRKKEALLADVPPPQQVVYAAPPPPPAGAYAPAPPAAAAPPAPAPAAAPAPAPAAAPPAALGGVEQASPMAGTFYRSPAPGEPAFAKEGDVVAKGQTICIIEAMKLMNEIEAETAGTLVAFCVDNATPVTPGMPLAIIKP